MTARYGEAEISGVHLSISSIAVRLIARPSDGDKEER
jgi:hypothetical protein